MNLFTFKWSIALDNWQNWASAEDSWNQHPRTTCGFTVHCSSFSIIWDWSRKLIALFACYFYLITAYYELKLVWFTCIAIYLTWNLNLILSSCRAREGFGGVFPVNCWYKFLNCFITSSLIGYKILLSLFWI